uniref:Pept_C1 domain-containing protein n=1 Tax=Steinernema glaseri TaxID=37863 RepID=A0A1I7XVX6_9BILA
MKDYGSAEFLVNEELEQERWSLYLIAKASDNLSALETLNSYHRYLERFPEKASRSRASIDRYQIYENKVKLIEELNDRLKDTQFEDNRFADWSEREIRKVLLPLDLDFKDLEADTFLNRSVPSFSAKVGALTGSFDWRKRNVISPVKDQGQCGSCWAFATTGLVEAANAISKSVSPISLSDQELVDCDTIDKGCEGGNVGYAVRYVYEKGLMTESAYPYTHNRGECRKSGFTSKITNAYLLKRDEQHLIDWLTHYGPFTVSINVTNDLMYYKSGVFQPIESDCRNKPIGRHALLVVGYGTSSNGANYWIVKNSWGTKWGTENGYLYFVRGKNACGIEEFPIGALA